MLVKALLKQKSTVIAFEPPTQVDVGLVPSGSVPLDKGSVGELEHVECVYLPGLGSRC